MAQSAFAYQQPQRRPRVKEQPLRPPLRILPGKGLDAQTQQGLAPYWRVLFAMGLTCVLLLGVVWFLCVTLTESTMALFADSEQVSQSIAAKRLKGSELEVEYSMATNPATIQQAAVDQLGMGPDEQVEYLRVLIDG